MASTKSIMERRKKLLGRLFTVDRSGTPVQYIVRPGMETEAAESWKEHGVCPVCFLRAITCGRCIQCGWESPERGGVARRTSTMDEESVIERVVARMVELDDGQDEMESELLALNVFNAFVLDASDIVCAGHEAKVRYLLGRGMNEEELLAYVNGRPLLRVTY